MRILVVEDDYLVASYLIDILEEEGATAVGPIGRVEEALEFLGREAQSIDAAVLDVNLNGQASYAIADALVRNGVRFVFTTGYGEGALNEAYRKYPRCQKPFRAEELVAALGGTQG